MSGCDLRNTGKLNSGETRWTIQVDRKHALQTLLVAIKAETGVIATDDSSDEPGDDMDLVEVGVACSDDAFLKASHPLTTVIELRILFPQLHW